MKSGDYNTQKNIHKSLDSYILTNFAFNHYFKHGS